MPRRGPNVAHPSSPKPSQASSSHVWTMFPTWAKRDSTEPWSIINSKPRLDQVQNFAQTWPSLNPKALPCSK
ncbi:hypothetical protein PIB30_081612, partial [Stylosanthes scabra]|nr:hypothetical protein [Stylosanthes scabra]